MRARRIAGIVLIGLLPAAGACAHGGPPELHHPGDFQSFVGNWTPLTAPLCAVLRSDDDWKRVLHPAAVMGDHKPFEPPDTFWTSRAILLFARVVNGGDTSHVFALRKLQVDPDAVDVDFAFTPTPPASWTQKTYIAVDMDKPLPPRVQFRENGKIVCTLDIAAGQVLTP